MNGDSDSDSESGADADNGNNGYGTVSDSSLQDYSGFDQSKADTAAALGNTAVTNAQLASLFDTTLNPININAKDITDFGKLGGFALPGVGLAAIAANIAEKGFGWQGFSFARDPNGIASGTAAPNLDSLFSGGNNFQGNNDDILTQLRNNYLRFTTNRTS